MAIYHLSVKTVARSAGRSATAAAAYRSGSRIHCEREGRLHDYSRRSGVVHREMMAPNDMPAWDRSALWNAAEAAERRSNSTVAREYELALPHELPRSEQVALTREFTSWLVDRYGIAADIAIHEPTGEHDRRNVHVHVLTTTRQVTAEGLGAKTRILDDQKTGPAEVETIRERWAAFTNERLRSHQRNRRDEAAGPINLIDHRSLDAQRERAGARAERREKTGEPEKAQRSRLVEEYCSRAPEVHMGPSAAAMERKERKQAVREQRAYEPVTNVGRLVHEARTARNDFARAAAILREAWKRAEELARQMSNNLADRLRSFGAAFVERDKQRQQEEMELARQREQEREREHQEQRKREAEARAQELRRQQESQPKPKSNRQSAQQKESRGEQTQKRGEPERQRTTPSRSSGWDQGM